MLIASLPRVADRLAFEHGILSAQSRVALLRNKTAILDALDAAGIETLVGSFHGCPFGSYLGKVEVFGSAGPRILPTTNIRYASPGRRSRFRHMKTRLRGALDAILEELLADAWDSVIDADGTLRIDVATRTFEISGRDHARQFHRVY